jgi:hypothetical protein
MAVFYASYSIDLAQMWRRPEEFPKSFVKFMNAHHWLSFAWWVGPGGLGPAEGRWKEGGPMALPSPWARTTGCRSRGGWRGL